MTTLSDALAGDVDAGFAALFEHTRHRVYALARSLCKNGHEAEEVAQDAYVRAYHALRSYAPARRRSLQARAWMATITANVWRNRVRGRKRERVSLDERWPDPGIGPAGEAERADEGRRVRELLATLPQRYRLALVMRYAYDLPYAEAAHALGVPVGTLKANVHRGTRLLREAYAASSRKGKR